MFLREMYLHYPVEVSSSNLDEIIHTFEVEPGTIYSMYYSRLRITLDDISAA